MKTFSPHDINALIREKNIATEAIRILELQIEEYEKTFKITKDSFMKEFEEGTLGDERHWFEMYGLTYSYHAWNDTKKEIEQRSVKL